MKNIIRILSIGFLTVSLGSCSDFLEENMGTNYGQEAIISTEQGLESAVLGIHRQMGVSSFKDGEFCEYLAPASGLAIWSGTNNLIHPHERWSCLHKFTRFSQHPQAYNSFRTFYRTIYLCNHLLDILPKSPVNEGYKEEIEGEVLFLRAMAYFYLVRLYGDVSLVLEAPKNTEKETLYKPRENFWTVYCQIIKDLNEAELKMRSFEEMVSRSGGSIDASGNVRMGNASGRVCDYAAIACRSSVYLTIGSLIRSVESNPDNNFWLKERTPDMMAGFAEIGITSANDAFALALKDAMQVIEPGHGGVPREIKDADGNVISTTVSPFKLCPDYRQLFRWTEPEDWQLRERIWAMPRSPESNGAGDGLVSWALPPSYNNTVENANWGRCRPDRWFFNQWCKMKKGSTGKANAANENLYVSCKDPRLDVNICYNSFVGKDNRTYNCYPNEKAIKAENMKREGIPYYKKYYDPTFNNSVGNADFYVMRLAEVYLIAAEANAVLGNWSESVRLVNVILKRARDSKDGDPSNQPADWSVSEFDTTDKLVNAIFWERCFEMPFEHHEYFDTHRHGAQWIIDNIAMPKNDFLNGTEHDDWYKDKKNEDGTTSQQLVEGYRSMYFGKKNVYDTDHASVRKGLISAYPYEELVYNPFLDESVNDPLRGQNPKEVFWK